MNERILKDMRSVFGLTVHEFSPVEGGYLNQKWKARTSRGDVLIKQYSPERFNHKKLNDIEQALKRQLLLHERGVACPRVYSTAGQIIRFLPEDLSYMVMDFAPGHVETPETCTPVQLESLGEECAKMHREFMHLPDQRVKGWPLNESSILAPLHALIRHIPADAPEEYLETIDQLRPVVQALPSDFLSRFPQSICHEDFSSDNMLFLSNRLSVIVDFDRNQYSWRHHDIARSLLSLTLVDDQIDLSRLRAFHRGYHQHLPLTFAEISDALRLTWCIEAPWWIQPGFFRDASSKVRRFIHEIQFLTRCWDVLDELIQG